MSSVMNSEVLLKQICANGGSMRYDQLVSDGTNTSSYGSDHVDKILKENESVVTELVNGQKTIIAKTQMRLCRAMDCDGCTNLHLCKFYLFGDCRFGRGRRSCRFSHDLQSERNILALQKHSLSHLDRQELCVLLLQNDNSILPPVCYSYNNGTGLHGRCEEAENCKRMHICERYLSGPCQCSRSHDFYEPHPLKTLQDRGVPTELMTSIKTTYSNLEALRKIARFRSNQSGGQRQEISSERPNRNYRSQTPEGNGGYRNNRDSNARNSQYSQEKTEICMYFIKGSCRNGERCFKEHSKVPYKWEVKEGEVWVALPDNEGIEKDYCNPEKTYSFGVYFDTMKRGCDIVRRLSTVSSVIQPNYILNTNWTWYWENEFGSWIPYASSGGNQQTASITSGELEQKFTQDNKAEVEFTAGSQTYTLSFQDMIQTNKSYGTKKLVRRRPVFVSAADADTIRTTKPGPSIRMKILPSHWNKALTPETGYKRFPLQTDSDEYSKVKRLFNTTMHGFSIQGIERIQNRALWEIFQWQKDQMKKNNMGKNIAEKQLFHGTDSKHIHAICNQNFDWRICGTHGTAYGKGSYFARDAKYSHSYTGDSIDRYMFVCRVLVGDYTVGDSSYNRPPSKDGGDTNFFDSCVNNVHNPSIFVVFEKQQIYPEYLIMYREMSSASSSDYSFPASVYQPTRPSTVHRVSHAYQSNPVSTVPSSTPKYQPQPARMTYPTSYPSNSYSSPPPSQSSKSDSSCVIC